MCNHQKGEERRGEEVGDSKGEKPVLELHTHWHSERRNTHSFTHKIQTDKHTHRSIIKHELGGEVEEREGQWE